MANEYTDTLRVRTLPNDKPEWQAAAKRAHMKFSDWVRVMLHAAAERAKTEPTWWQAGGK